MKRRDGDEVRPRHPDALYAAITLPGGLNGEHHFRIPSPLAARHLMDIVSKGGDAFAMMRTHAAVVGMAWHNERYDLETPPEDDILAFGEAVFEELHAAGYRLEHLALFSGVIVNEIGELMAISKEVTERLGFLRPSPEESGSTTSDSAPSTSETPSHSTA
jgi:hypothetical protein